MLGRGIEVRGFAAFARPVLRLYEATVSSGANTPTANSDGLLSLGAWTNGKATLTIPRVKKAVLLNGEIMTNSDTAGSIHKVYAKSRAVTSGTMALSTISFDATPVSSDNPTDGSTVSLLVLLDEGSA